MPDPPVTGMVEGVSTPEILDIVPEHVADPVRRAPWRVRLRVALGDGILSLLLNVIVVGGMLGAGWPLRNVEAPAAISVDLVDHMPETKAVGADGSAPGETPAAKAPGEQSADASTNAAEAPQAPAVETQPSPAPRPTQPQPPESQPVETPQPPAEAKPEPPPQPAAPPETASETPQPPAASPSAPSTPQSAVPPPPEHPDANPEPRLVEAPVPPPDAEQKAADAAQPAAVSPPAPEPAETAVAPAPAPAVLSSRTGDDVVAAPQPLPDPPKPLTAEQQRQAENTAKLAAMLPFGANIAASPFQVPASRQDREASDAYRGRVYANFNKARDVIETAKANHLRGQAVVAFTVDDRGELANIGIAISSGNPQVDQAALELIRRAAPFPAPPPGAQRSFSPAIGLGLDD